MKGKLMRKGVISLLLVVVLVMSSMTAFAAGATGTMTSADFKATAVENEITLEDDVTLEDKLVIEANEALTINLNSHKLTTTTTSDNYDIVVKGSLTINGEGTVYLSGAYGIGTSTTCTGGVTINGGDYIASDANVYMVGCFGGEVVITDGTFDGNYCVVNNFDTWTGKVTITGGEFTTTDETDETSAPLLGHTIAVSGGTFSEEIPEEYIAEGEELYVDPTTGESYIAIELTMTILVDGKEIEDGSYTVSAPKGYVFTEDDIKELNGLKEDLSDETLTLVGFYWDKDGKDAIVAGDTLTGDATLYVIAKTVDETPAPTPTPDTNTPGTGTTSPDTGDVSPVGLYVVILAAAVVAVGGFRMRKVVR